MSTDLKPAAGKGGARLAALVAGGAMGSILALVGANVAWPVIGPVAYVAIATIGSVAGAAIGAIALEIRFRT